MAGEGRRGEELEAEVGATAQERDQAKSDDGHLVPVATGELVQLSFSAGVPGLAQSVFFSGKGYFLRKSFYIAEMFDQVVSGFDSHVSYSQSKQD